MKSLLFAAVLCFSLSAQTGQQQNPCQQVSNSCYFVSKTTTLAAATEKVTIQTTSGTNKIVFQNATVRCSVACVVTFSSNGTAATSATLSITSLNGVIVGSGAAFSSSNVGAGTTGKFYPMEAAGTATFDLSDRFLVRRGNTESNLSIGVSSMTGDVTIQISYYEAN